MAWYLMIKCLSYCNSFPAPRAQFPLLFATFFYAEHDVCVTAVLRDTGGGGGGGEGGGGGCPRRAVVSPAHTPLSSRPHCRLSTSALPYTAYPCSYQAPIVSLPPSHVSTPPSGSSKYFPSLLFEASMGHGTSCTNHAGLPWGGRSERTGVSQTRRNPICTVFIRGYFSCQDSHHQSAAGSKQRV